MRSHIWRRFSTVNGFFRKLPCRFCDRLRRLAGPSSRDRSSVFGWANPPIGLQRADEVFPEKGTARPLPLGKPFRRGTSCLPAKALKLDFQRDRQAWAAGSRAWAGRAHMGGKLRLSRPSARFLEAYQWVGCISVRRPVWCGGHMLAAERVVKSRFEMNRRTAAQQGLNRSPVWGGAWTQSIEPMGSWTQ